MPPPDDELLKRFNAAKMGAAPTEAPAPAGPGVQGGVLSNLVRQAANGMTFGGADELSAAADAAVGGAIRTTDLPEGMRPAPGSFSDKPTFGERYGENLQWQRDTDKAFQKEYPILSTAARATGNMASLLTLARLSPGMARMMFGTGGRLATMARGAGTGAVAGGTQGFLEGEGGVGPRLENAGYGAAAGGTVGGVLGAMFPNSVARSALQEAGPSGASNLANRVANEVPVPGQPALPAPAAPPAPPAAPSPTPLPSTGRALAGAAGAGAGSEAAGQATQGTPLELPARVIGGLGGGFAGSMGAGTAADLTGRAVAAARGQQAPAPWQTQDPMRGRYVQELQNAGVPLSPGQITGDQRALYKEDYLRTQPLTADRMASRDEATRRAFTQEVLRRAGITSDQLQPEQWNQARRDVGRTMDMLTERTSVLPDEQYQQAIIQAAERYADRPFADIRQGILSYLQNVGAGAGVSGESGQRSGQWVINARHRLQAWEDSSDPGLRDAGSMVRQALDDLVERQMPANAQGFWREARGLYRNLMVVRDATTGSKEGMLGNIPVGAYAAAERARNKNVFAGNTGQNTDLAKAGATVLAPLPNSGTAQRIQAAAEPVLGGAAGGAGLGYMLGLDPIASGMLGAGARYLTPLAQYGAHYYLPQLDPNAAAAGLLGSVPTVAPPMMRRR